MHVFDVAVTGDVVVDDGEVDAGQTVSAGCGACRADALDEAAVGWARSGDLEGDRAGHVGDGPFEADEAEIRPGDGFGSLHDLVERHSKLAASIDLLPDACSA